MHQIAAVVTQSVTHPPPTHSVR